MLRLPSMMKAPRIAIVGAGLSGLACAVDLADRGYDVDVLERDATVGGRMNTRRREGFAFDFGANFLADCYAGVEALARRAGVATESVGIVQHVVLHDARMHRLALSCLADALGFAGLSSWTKLRAAAFAAWSMRRHAGLSFFDLDTLPDELLELDAYDYASRHVSREFADLIVDPFTSTMMFYRAHDICAGGFVALFAMMASGRYSFGVRRIVGGMRALPEALARLTGVRTGVTVESVRAVECGVRVRGPGLDELYDGAVLACPAPAALALLAEPTPEQRALLAGTEYSRTIDVSFRMPAAALPGVHCVYVPYRESPLVSELTNEGIKREDTVHGGLTLLNVGLHEAGAAPLMDRPDGEVFARVREELARLHPQLAELSHGLVPHDLQRWTVALPRYRGDHVARVRRFWSAAQGEGRIWLCGDYMNHPWLEGAALCGARVAQRVSRALPALTTPAARARCGAPWPRAARRRSRRTRRRSRGRGAG